MTRRRTQADMKARALKAAQHATDMAAEGRKQQAEGHGGFGADIIATAGSLALVSIANSLALFVSLEELDAEGVE